MTVRDRLSLVAALAVLLASSALVPVFSTLAWVPRTAGVVLLVLVVSALCRRAAVPRSLQPVATTLAVLAYLTVLFVPSSLTSGTPGSATYVALRALVRVAGDDLAQYAPPAPPTTALVLLVVGGVGLVAVVVDALASVIARPAAAGLPLLALFAVPSAVLPGGLGWLPFALGAAGWLALLLVEGREDAGRWGSTVSTARAADDFRAGAAGVGRLGRRIGGAALGVAVLVPALVPGLQGRLFDGGEGGGGGNGHSRSVTTYNPITRLRGELTLPAPVEVLHYRTDDPQPDYLRMTTLGVYDGSGWRQEVLRGNLRDNGVDDPVPTPSGRSTVLTTRSVVDQVDIDTLDAFWLPAPATPSVVDVKGPWMWDAGSESVFSTRSNTSKVTSYTVRSSRVLPDPAQLTVSDGPLPGEVKPYSTPIVVTPAVRALTERIVQSQSTDYGRAAALQNYFRNPANGFTYALDTTTGGSPDALEDFLRNKQGFCEQYASAMAAMLRVAGVPSRVAVGFTPGKRQADGSYVVTTSEAHAWPEAWFEGAGWVRFEPTPSQGGIRPPQYAGPQSPGTTSGPAGSSGPSAASPGDIDGPETPAERLERQQADREDRQAAPATPIGTTPVGRPPVRRVAGGGLALLLLGSPAALHALRRRLRRRAPTPASVWAQLRDDVTDTGHDWRPAETPRTAAARLTSEAGLDAPAAQALQRLSSALERARYGRPSSPSSASGSSSGSSSSSGAGAESLAAGAAGAGAAAGGAAALRADGAVVRRALLSTTRRGQRLRAVLVPPSTVTWASSRVGGRLADLLDAADSGLSAVGTRLRRRST